MLKAKLALYKLLETLFLTNLICSHQVKFLPSRTTNKGNFYKISSLGCANSQEDSKASPTSHTGFPKIKILIKRLKSVLPHLSAL